MPHLVAVADPGHPDGQHDHADPDQVPGHQDYGRHGERLHDPVQGQLARDQQRDAQHTERRDQQR